MLTRILLAPDAPAGAASVAPKPAPAAPSPTPQPAAKPAPEPSGGDSDPFSELDAKATFKKPEKKPEPTDLPPDTGKTGAEGGDKDKLGTAPDGKRIEPKWYRDAIAKKDAELKPALEKAAALEKKIKEYESSGKDTTAMTERLATLEKQIAERDDIIRQTKFEVSPEFKAKYQEPFDRAADYAAQQVSQMEVTDPETGTVRPAVWDKDFAAIYQMPIGKAHKMAQELFGDSAPFVMQQYDRLHQLDYEKSKAMEGEKVNAKTREQENITKRQQQQEAIKAMWTAVDRDVKERSPHFQDDPADPEGNELLQAGYALVDKAFGAENRNRLTPKQLVTLDANIRHRAAGFTRLVHKTNRLTEELAAAKAEIEQFRKGGPGPGTRTESGGGGGKKEETIKTDDIWDELKAATPD